MIRQRFWDIPLSRILYLFLVVGGPVLTAFFCQTFVTDGMQRILPLLSLAVAAACSVKDRDGLCLTFGSGAMVLFFLWATLDQNRAFSGGITSAMCINWIFIFGCTMLTVLVLACARKRRWPSFFWTLLLMIGVFYAIMTIASWLAPSFHDAIYRRFFSGLSAVQDASDWKAGFTNHYSTNGMYLALGLIGCIPLLLNRQKNMVVRVLPLIVILLALLLTTKRAHLVFGVGSIAVSLLLYGSQEKLSTAFKAIIVAVIAVSALYIASLYLPDLMGTFNRIAQIRSDDDTATTDRLYFSLLCQQMWSESPIVGSGMGSYAIAFNMTGLSANYIATGYPVMYAHNCFWQVLAEQGAIGFILLVLAFSSNLIGSIRLLFQLNRERGGQKTRAHLSGSIAIQIFFILYCSTGNPLYDMQTYIPYLLSVGVYLAVRRQVVEAGLLAAERKINPSRRSMPDVPGTSRAGGRYASEGHAIYGRYN